VGISSNDSPPPKKKNRAKILGQGIWNEQVEIPNDFHETCGCSAIFVNNAYTEFHENTTHNVVADKS